MGQLLTESTSCGYSTAKTLRHEASEAITQAFDEVALQHSHISGSSSCKQVEAGRLQLHR